MGFHHLAFATRDTKATHAFYTQAMGFRLAKVEVGPTPTGGWAKHIFYEIGGEGMIAFWELHDATLPADFSPSISRGLGLPHWVNHVAFTAADRADLTRRRERWVAHGHDVLELDHGWCTSIYAVDPNDILVEFCLTTRAFTAEEVASAERLLADPAPPVATPPAEPQVFKADPASTGTAG